MPDINTNKAILILQDGTFFYGRAFGKPGTTTGEICFNTGMTGYQEVFTDPSYFGQVLIMNTVHIGNYGATTADFESDGVKIKGVIARNLEEKYSRQLAENSLQEYLFQQNIVCITGIDTRSLVAHIRRKGAMNCIISSIDFNIENLKRQLMQVPDMKNMELASLVSTPQPYTLGTENNILRVAVLDLGVKKNILNCLVERGAYIKVFPAKTSVEEMEKFNPTGYFISNGPGDPGAMDYAVKTVKQLLEINKPLFGICLGHQLLALANDIPTFKMHHGHRGLNHPVKNIIRNHCEITTQNHGFGIDPEMTRSNPGIEITHINLNDGVLKGFG